ncbi:LytR C-terminal domain-containing protein [Telluria beijingensis]|uniref:LytR C-terminal domain-containing protein n=1 Tax=Telluria beijingensis TaxID=3068633 RepID=UPI00279601E2|nr:LytR C-terminal domain-containing protein [Massilia sp. REN29]
MNRTVKLTRLALLCAGLMACSPFGWRAAHDSGARAEEAYLEGRAHHLAAQPDAARLAYNAALMLAPDHAGARNGLATLHAEDGALAPAIAIWRDLASTIGLDAGPGKAYLLANLGQALLLDGQADEARAVLEGACLLDPLNPRAWQLLGDALAALGQEDRARQMQRQAATLRGHDLRADFAAVTGGRTDVATLDQALSKPQLQLPPQPDWAQAWIVAGQDGLLELRRTPSVSPVALPVDEEVARLEIRNGNGVTGMARALSRRIDEPGMRVTRLSNAPGFAVRHTRIEYEAAHADAARRLAQRFGNAELREVDACAPADLRLVLGRDLAGQGGSQGAVLRYTRT